MSHLVQTLNRSTGRLWPVFLTRPSAIALVALVAFAHALRAQGVLTITPGKTATTAAGTGIVGYTGDGAAATAATLASPSAVAYDAAGNLFIADANNHVVREVVKSSGSIVTIAGTGIAGYSGDGGTATSAQLDTPTGVAVDAAGNVYIADSHNHRIRKVIGTTISTLAGTGTAGFSGDGAAAASAALALPSAVAVDTNGNVYIADTNNQRIRKITGTTISTVAGNGEELYAGDGSAATAASLDSPTGVAVDASGTIYIADRHNQRIRMVNAGGTISTLAGSGTPTFAGGYSGDGAAATAASLSKPSGVSVDASGNVYIADTNNQRIRQVGNSGIATVEGTGAQDFGGDGGAAEAALLNAPKSVAVDTTGNLAVADTLNQRVRSTTLPAIAFPTEGVGVASAPETVTLANTGTASLTLSQISISTNFTIVTGGSCSATPITIAAGSSCTVNVVFLPVASGAASGSISFLGTDIPAQNILLTGTAVQTSTNTTLVSSLAQPLINQAITFTATIAPQSGIGVPTGTVTFTANGAQIGTPQPLVNGVAQVSTSFSAAGSYSIEAAYSGDANFIASTLTIAQKVNDFNFTIVPDPTIPAGSGNQTVLPGGTATYNFNITPLDGSFPYPVTLSATGAPDGSTVTFTPNPVTLGSTATHFSISVQVPAVTSTLRRNHIFRGGAITFALVFLPFAGLMRRRSRNMRPLTMMVFCILSLAAIGGLAGCGTNSGFFGQEPKSYTITVTGTATGSNGATLQHSSTVALTVQ